MRRGEVARRIRRSAAETREDLAVRVEDRNAAVAIFTDLLALRRLQSLTPPQLRDVEAAIGTEHEMGRPLHVRPLREELPVRREHLDAVVLAVAHEDATIAEDADAVRDLELSRPGAGIAPRSDEPAVGHEVMHTRVAVAVTDVQLAVRRDRDVRRSVVRTRGARDRRQVRSVVSRV